MLYPLVPIEGLITRNAIAFYCVPSPNLSWLECGLVLVNEGVSNGDARIFANAITSERYNLTFEIDEPLQPGRGYNDVILRVIP